MINRTMKSVLGHFNLRLERGAGSNGPDTREKYLSLLRDVDRLFCESILSGLPKNPQRAGLLADLEGMLVFHALFLLDCLRKTLPLPGAVCEFGCANGATSALIGNEIRDTEKNFWIFDSFQGLSKPTKEDVLTDDFLGLGAMERYEGAMSCPATAVNERLKAVSFPPSRTKIVPGFVEQTIKGTDVPCEVCFALVDFDLYSPVLTALQFLHDRLAEGALVIVHDYGYFSTGAKAALDEFLAQHPSDYDFSLPELLDGHHALIRKNARTSDAG